MSSKLVKNGKAIHAVAFQFALAILFSTYGYAEVPLLERVISITLETEKMDVALHKISQQGNFTFSYNPTVIDASRIVSASFNGTTVREVLDELFKGSVQYKTRGNYIILTKGQVSSSANSQTYSGYVVDETTGARLKNVSVYDPVSLSSALTDAYGYFQIKVDKPPADLLLAVKKKNYSDTIVAVQPGRTNLLKIPIRIDEDKIESIADSVAEKVKRFWETKVLSLNPINTDNITDTIYRTTQVSLFPYMGTNHHLSGNVINDYSFNIFGGYSRGVRKLEIGGLFNIDRDDVDGFQFAGIFNAVGGKASAMQFAGLANLNLDSVKGAQFAGLINLNGNSSQKFSGAGLVNVTHGNSMGSQLAGHGNITMGDQQGPHIAGLFNLATGDGGPVQVAGMMNYAGRNFEGTQAGGIFNFVGNEIHGAQIGGLINVAAKRISGVQVSGLINYAKKIKGVQIGFLNVADSIHGVPLGFMSFVLKGYHKIEISADEIFYTNLAFRTGVSHFYNILTAGVKPGSFEQDETFWTFGYGIGTAPRLTRWLNLNIDITTSQIVKGDNIEAINLLNKVFVGLEFEPAKKIGLAIGVTLNGQVTDATYTPYPELFTDYTPDIRYDHTYSNDLNLKVWWGGKVGLRFL
ncbi:MAG TPA: STN domain-containing protein [Chryseolinea sp.]|nr:STN domain-containing protein [Chryseolinea sp.]